MKMFKILETAWLVIGLIGVIMIGYFIINKDKEGAIYFAIFTVVAGIMYSVRKRQRIRMQGNQNQISKK
jgi:inner membrane protein involved in colicin E2 resistance